MPEQTEEKIIMYESDEAAVYKECKIKGWFSKNKRTGIEDFYGQQERSARWYGSTHRKCECGNTHRKEYSICKDCRYKKSVERFLKLEKVEWDEETPVCLFDSDEYFYSEDDIQNYCDDNSCSRDEMHLVLCKPQTLSHIDPDYWSDDLPEEEELPEDVLNAIGNLNTELENAGTVSWYHGNKRIT